MKARFVHTPQKIGERYSGEIQFTDGLLCQFDWSPLDDRARFSYRLCEYEHIRSEFRSKLGPVSFWQRGLPGPDYQTAAMKLLIEYTAHWARLDHNESLGRKPQENGQRVNDLERLQCQSMQHPHRRHAMKQLLAASFLALPLIVTAQPRERL